MIELVFVIVVLGILAAIAIPKFAATRDDAKVSSARVIIAAVRSGIVTERQKRLFRGDSTYMSDANLSNGGIFGGVLQTPNPTGWTHATPNYTYTLKAGQTAVFTYAQANGTFNCAASTLCTKLTQ